MCRQFQKLFILILCCVGIRPALFCQGDTARNRGLKVKEKEKAAWGNTYALVVGISGYKNIEQLNYADDDAKAIRDYFLDAKIVRRENMYDLIDSNATRSSVFANLKKIYDKIRPDSNDRVFFYFAGHGDNESHTGQGYLLAYDCEKASYASTDAIFIPQLEAEINSLATRAKVIVITDACRSGNLAGQKAGALLTMKVLNAGFAGITKILSSEEEQLSQEKDFPGGGHGVFTYYLLDALNGLCVSDSTKVISLSKIEDYIKKYVSENTGEEQRPVVTGTSSEIITMVIPEMRQAMMASKRAGSGGAVVKRENKQNSINVSPADSVYFKLFYDHLRARRLNTPKGNNAYETYKTAKEKISNKDLLNSMKYDLSAKLEDAVQPLLNQFIRGEFQDYPDSLFNDANNKLKIVQDELVDSADFRYNEIRAKRIFFIASVYKTPRALQLLHIADSLMPNTAFINFEIGRYYSEVQQFSDSALKYLNKAILLSPRWSYPRFMLGNIYYRNKEYNRAQTFFTQAIELQPGFAYALFNQAMTFKQLKQKDSADYYYQKALMLDKSFAREWDGERKTADEIISLGKAVRSAEINDEAMFAGLLPPGLKTPVPSASSEARDGYSFYSRAYYHIKDGNTDSARYWYNKAVGMFEKAYANKTMPLGYYYTWGYTHQALGNYEKAKEIYKLGLKADTVDFDLYDFGIAWITDKEDKTAEALQWYKKAFSYNPRYYQAANNIGWAYARMKMPDSAIYYYRLALQISPDFTTTISNLGNIYFESYKDDSAIYYYKKLNRLLAVPDAFAWNRIGISYDYLGQYDSAIIYYGKAISVDDKEPVYFRNMGNTYYNNKQYLKAIQHYEHANSMLPDSSKAYFNLALSYAYLDNYKKAEEIFRESLLKEKGNKNIYLNYYNLGWTLDKQKKLKEALHWYAMAVKANPTYLNGLNNLGYTYDRLAKNDSAIYWYQQALKINPAYTNALYNLASLYNDKYKYDSSLYYYKLLLPLAPTNAAVPYEIGQLYYYDANYDSAIVYYRKAIALNNKKADYYTKAGDAYFDATTSVKYQGNSAFYQKAIEYYSNAIRLDSTQFLAMNRLGVSYIYLGKYKEGIAVFEMALRKDAVYKNTYEYNLACIFSLQKDFDKALNYFDRSINSGYRDLAHITEDTDLDNVRSLPLFKAIIEKYFKPDEVSKNPDLYKKKN